MRKVLLWLMFFILAAENPDEGVYERKFSTILAPVGSLLYKGLPINLPPLDVIIIVMLLMARSRQGAKTGRVPALDKSVWLCVAGVLVACVWGFIRGGDMHQAYYQVHMFLVLPAFAFLCSSVFRVPRDLVPLGKMVIAAALFRAVHAIYYYYVICAPLNHKPDCVTTHHDTMLFVLAFLITAVYPIFARKGRSIVSNVSILAILLVAIQINNRRLAYASLIEGLVLVYLLLPKSSIKTRVTSAVLKVIPLIVIYFAVGWNSTSTIFKPAHSLSTMFGGENTSTAMRNIENYNLMVTAKRNGLLGVGFGHEYDEISVAISIADIFPQYRYLPHNTVLGIYAFTGYVGSSLMFSMFVVTAYLGARASRFARAAPERTAASICVAFVLIFMNQVWGDQGWAWTGMTLMAATMAVASRLAVWVDAWPGKHRSRQTATQTMSLPAA